MATIMETLADYSSQTPLFELVEYIRTALKRAICTRFLDDENKLHILRFDPAIENEIYKNLGSREDGSPIITIRPDYLNELQNVIKEKITNMFEEGYPPIILCQPPVRRAVWDICKHINRNIVVISTREIISNIEVVLFGQILLKEKVNN